MHTAKILNNAPTYSRLRPEAAVTERAKTPGVASEKTVSTPNRNRKLERVSIKIPAFKLIDESRKDKDSDNEDECSLLKETQGVSYLAIQLLRDMSEANPRAPSAIEQTVLYFACKDERFSLRKDFKVLSRALKQLYGFVVLQLQEEMGEEAVLPCCSMIILAGLRKPLLPKELSLLNDYLEGGGRVIVLAEANSNAEVYNEFTTNFGITVLKDSLVRTDRYKEYHPLDCFIKQAMICPTLMKQCEEGSEPQNFSILYPKGCTLEVCKDALPIVSSGLSCYPSGRPLGAIYVNPKSNGKLVVLGSARIFTDEYITKEENLKALSFFVDLLTSPDELNLEPMHIDDFHLKDYDVAHETANKSCSYRSCLQDTNEFIFPGSANTMGIIEPKNLVSAVLSHADFEMLPLVFQTYEHLKLDRKILSRFIMPQLELPLPKLRLAQFPPKFRDLVGPPLELFDLNEEFSPRETMLGRIINKCSEKDLEYCIETLGSILGVDVDNVELAGKNKHKAILRSMASELASFKTRPSTFPDVSDDDDDSMKSSMHDPIIRALPFARSESRC